MHMGGISTIGNLRLKNFIHIILNNESHDSVGGQPTSASSTSLTKVAMACGYKNIIGPLKTEKDVLKNLKLSINYRTGPSFIEIMVKNGSRKNLGRPKEKPINNKNSFYKNIKK